MNTAGQTPGIILFDGECNLCNFWVNFLLKRDHRNAFLFAPLQSEAAKKLVAEYQLELPGMESFIYIEKGRAHLRSGAALRIARKLPGLWPLLFGLIIVPPFLRNAVYNFIARNRYRWWGKRDSCMVPTEEIRKKFIS